MKLKKILTGFCLTCSIISYLLYLDLKLMHWSGSGATFNASLVFIIAWALLFLWNEIKAIFKGITGL